MTKEELEKEAGEYADEHAFRVPYDGSNKFYDDVDFKASKEGYIAGAKPREKRIAELERKLEQTEKDLTDYQFNYPKILDLEKENAELKERAERYYRLLAESMVCETCKYYDEELDKDDKEPCKSCFFDNSKWEIKENE